MYLTCSDAVQRRAHKRLYCVSSIYVPDYTDQTHLKTTCAWWMNESGGEKGANAWYKQMVQIENEKKTRTVPNWPKNALISSSLISVVRPPTKILPWRAFAFFGSTFLLLMMCSGATETLSIDSADAYTMKAKPRLRPVCGSVFTLMLSISPYCPKCSRSSSVARKRNRMGLGMHSGCVYAITLTFCGLPAQAADKQFPAQDTEVKLVLGGFEGEGVYVWRVDRERVRNREGMERRNIHNISQYRWNAQFQRETVFCLLLLRDLSRD